MPPLVATASLTKEEVDRLRSSFLQVREERSLDEARTALLIDRFVVPDGLVYLDGAGAKRSAASSSIAGMATGCR